MKKLIGLLTVLLVTANIFGQGSAFTNIIQEGRYVDIGDAYRQKHITDPTKNSEAQDWRRVTYQFVANGKQYLISYESFENCTDIQNGITSGMISISKRSGFFVDVNYTIHRNLYLYRWDGTAWNIAVDKPLRVDSFRYDDNWNLTCDCYFPQMYGGNDDGRSEKEYRNSRIFDSKYDGYIKKLSNGNIEVKLSVFAYKKQQLCWTPKVYYSEKITLKPNGNNTYKIK